MGGGVLILAWVLRNTVLLVVYFMGVKLCLPHLRRNKGSRCSRIGYSGRYLDLREKMKRRSGEDYITGSFIMGTPSDVIRVIK